MAYPEDNLHPNEELVLHIHPHWWFMTWSVVVLVVSIVFGITALVRDWHGVIKTFAAVLVLGAVVFVAERYVRWLSTHFALTSDRVIYRSGVIAKRGIEIPLESINAIHFSQTIFERLLQLGDIQIDSASVKGVSEFEDIAHPDKVQNEIYLQMEANDQRRFSGGHLQAAQAAAAQASIPDQIEQLARLRDAGTISEEEFQAKKADLLERM